MWRRPFAIAALLLLPLLLLDGCSFNTPSSSDDTGDDVPPDACMTFSHQFDTCAQTYDQEVELPGRSFIFNTDTGTLVIGTTVQPTLPSKVVMATSGMMRVVTARSFQLDVGAILRVEGSLPFAIASPGKLNIAGVIDASSGGAGVRATCVISDGEAGGNQGGGAGGGGGAGASALGGKGGDGNNDGPHGTGGPAGMTFPKPSGPLGGCPGGKGGDGEDPGGPGGPGGGTVYLVSRDQVSIVGGINVGGGGGRGGTSAGGGDSDGGGGGGGSGGTIVLEGPVLVTGKLASNGGAGGQGSGEGAVGGDGAAGTLDAMQAACMHSNSSSGTDGAKGGALGHLDGETQTKINAGAGGGGGGGVGYILIDGVAPQITGVVSPAAVIL